MKYTMLCEKGLSAFAKGIGPLQPAQSAQADMAGNCSLFLNSMHVKG